MDISSGKLSGLERLKMRSIRFRAWDKKNKEMTEFANYGILTEESEGLLFFRQDHTKESSGEFELMQFTGLKDKNGKEIYEGDIVLHKECEFDVLWCNASFKLMERKSLVSMEFGDCFFSDILGRVCNCNVDSLWDFEVIGNIYENPELFKEKYDQPNK